MRLRDADQLVGAAAAGVVDRHHLDVLGEGVVDLAVARLDVSREVLDLELRSAGDLVHAVDEVGEVVGHHEVDAVLLERLDRAGRALGQAALGEELQVLAGDVGVLLGAGERELLLDDRLGQHEPRVVVAGGQDLLHRADRVRAGHARHALEPTAGGVEPHRRRAGQDPDGVVGPDRVPVVDALDVGPHPVLVDHRRAGVLGDALHPAVDVRGDAGDHVLGRGADALGRPVAAHQLVVVADAAGGDDDGRRRGARSRRPRRGRTSRRARQSSSASTVPRTPTTAPSSTTSSSTWWRNAKRTSPCGLGLSTGSAKIRTTSGPVPQVRWKRGTELPWPVARPSPRSAQPTNGSDLRPRAWR